MLKAELVENPIRLLEYLRKEKVTFFKDIKKINKIEKLKDYTYKGERIKILKYDLIIARKKKKVYGFFSSKKNAPKFKNKRFILNKLQEYNFSHGTLQAPKPLIFLSKVNLLIREEAPGKTLLQILQSKKMPKRVIENSAKWIAKLHNIEIGKEKFVSALEIEKKEFPHYCQIAKNYFTKNQMEKMKNSLSFIHKITKSFSDTLIHGDFQAQNIIYNKKKDTTTVIDFDWSGIGDHFSDIGNFLVQFDYQSYKLFSQSHIIKAKKDFLDSYFKLRGTKFQNLSQRINAYQAKFAIQRAIFLIEFDGSPYRGKKKSTIINLLAKSENCLKDKEKLNLKVYPYSYVV